MSARVGAGLGGAALPRRPAAGRCVQGCSCLAALSGQLRPLWQLCLAGAAQRRAARVSAPCPALLGGGKSVSAAQRDAGIGGVLPGRQLPRRGTAALSPGDGVFLKLGPV